MIDKVLDQILKAESTAKLLAALVVFLLIGLIWLSRRVQSDNEEWRKNALTTSNALMQEITELRKTIDDDRKILAEIFREQQKVILDKFASKTNASQTSNVEKAQ